MAVVVEAVYGRWEWESRASDTGRLKGESRADGTGRYKGEKVNVKLPGSPDHPAKNGQIWVPHVLNFNILCVHILTLQV